MRYTFSLFLILIAFWVINSGYYTALLLFLGGLSILLVLWLTHRMKLIDHESLPFHLLTRIAPFYCWLSKEIILGCLYVLKKVVLNGKNLDPKVITLKLDFKDELSKVIFANSITLVPGTLSLQLTHNSIQVHALTEELADKLADGELARRVRRLER